MVVIDRTDLVAEFTSGSDQRAEAAALRLAAGEKKRLLVLEQLFNDSEVEVRWWATRALAEIHEPGVTPLLLQALEDDVPEVRQCAALALRSHPDPAAIPPLIQALSLPDRLTARLVADALIAIGEESVPPLIEVLGNGPLVARPQAAHALGEIGDPHAIPALFKALDDDSALLEYWAEESLQKMGVGMVFFNPQ